LYLKKRKGLTSLNWAANSANDGGQTFTQNESQEQTLWLAPESCSDEPLPGPRRREEGQWTRRLSEESRMSKGPAPIDVPTRKSAQFWNIDGNCRQ
jgi:hypothetical protein